MVEKAFIQKEKPIKPTPGELDEAMYPQDARDCGMPIVTDCYPWHALTGRRFPVPGDWSRHVKDEQINVYTDIETGLRQGIEDAIKDLTQAEAFTQPLVYRKLMGQIAGNLLKTLEKNKLLPE